MDKDGEIIIKEKIDTNEVIDRKQPCSNATYYFCEEMADTRCTKTEYCKYKQIAREADGTIVVLCRR